MSRLMAQNMAKTYRTMANRCLNHTADGKAGRSGAEPEIKEAHEALRRALHKIEEVNELKEQ